jgi:hypothetical protein
MAEAKKLSVADALAQAELIETTLSVFEQTAPEAVRILGGRDALAACAEMTCIGPMPRLDQDAWEKLSREYQDRRDWEARVKSGGAQ